MIGASDMYPPAGMSGEAHGGLGRGGVGTWESQPSTKTSDTCAAQGKVGFATKTHVGNVVQHSTKTPTSQDRPGPTQKPRAY